MKNKETITLELSFPDGMGGKISREVLFDSTVWGAVRGSQFHSERIFAARVGRSGKKIHSTEGRVHCFTPEEAKKLGYISFTKKPNFIDEFGNLYFFRLDTSLRNNQAYIVGFADTYIGTDQETKQKYYGSLKTLEA